MNKIYEITFSFQILDGITRLAKVYTELSAAGCILFKQWNATFFCDPDRNVHSEIDFGSSTKKMVIRGMKKDTREVSDQIKRVCESMEGCLNDWTHHIKVQRKQFYFLNCFTTEQLVILCKEIAKFWKNEHGYSRLIYHTLDRVRSSCTEQVSWYLSNT